MGIYIYAKFSEHMVLPELHTYLTISPFGRFDYKPICIQRAKLKIAFLLFNAYNYMWGKATLLYLKK